MGGWVSLLEEVGFTVEMDDGEGLEISNVETEAWVRGKQVSKAQLPILNHFILTAPSNAQREFNINSETHPDWVGKYDLELHEVEDQKDDLVVNIEYPTVVIKAVKR
jgi:hypothetical protein